MALGVVLGGLLGTPSRGHAGSDLPSELTTVSEVRFQGRHAVSLKELKSAVKTRSSSLFLFRERPLLRIDFLRADTASIENAYTQHGYLEAHAGYRLDPAKEHGAMRVTFVIVEGRRARIDKVELDGITVIDSGLLRRTLFARPGKAFNPYFLNADTTKIAQAYQDRGYFPEVRSEIERSQSGSSITVRYHVSEGPRFRFGPVAIDHPETLSVPEHFARRELLLKPGAVYRSSRVQQSIQRLYETGIFRQVQMTPVIDTTSATVAFELALNERKPRWVDTGIGSGTSDRLRATGEWGHRNLFGRGMQGVLSGRLALDGQARFLLSHFEGSVLEPWLFATRTRGLLTVYYENQHDRTDPKKLVGSEVNDVSFQVQRQLGRYAKLSLTQDNTFVHQQVTFFRAGLADSANDVPRYTTHRVRVGVERDTRDVPLHMTRGSYQSLASEVVGGPLRGTSSFTKHQLASSWYTPLKPGWVLATRAHGGVIRPFGTPFQFTQEPGVDPEVARVPLLDRFKIGGVNSLRGYDEGRLPAAGGLVVLQGNVELRVDLLGPFGVEAYVEAGNVWARVSDVSRSTFSPGVGTRRMTPNDVRWVYGFGPRVRLPFGPLRLDITWWARPDESGARQRAKVQFAIGPAF